MAVKRPEEEAPRSRFFAWQGTNLPPVGLFRQSQKVNSPKFAGTAFWEVRIASVCNPSAALSADSDTRSLALVGNPFGSTSPALAVIRETPDRVHLLVKQMHQEIE